MIKLRLSGVVGYDITADDVSNFLNQNDDKDITIFLNSPGGYVIDGLEIYNLLRASGRNITTVLTGMAASMGSILFLAGDKRIAMSGTLFMIHKPSGIAWGDADDFRKEADLLDKMQGSLQEIYEDRAAIGNLEQLINEEKWFNVEEMASNGIVNSDEPVSFDGVIDTDENNEGLIGLESEDAMAKIDDLKAEKEKLEAEKALLEEQMEEARLEAEVANMKADVANLKAKAEAASEPTTNTEPEPEPEEDDEPEDAVVTEAESKEDDDESEIEPEPNPEPVVKESAVIDTKKTVVAEQKNQIPAFMQAESKY